ncbi:MAG: biotin synthase BioB [Lentisphaerae bacterium GWF2_45_14]|nr:MAG: biotin synthase BioB [Lentisphaerae bacterium GWF2_45_14]
MKGISPLEAAGLLTLTAEKDIYELFSRASAARIENSACKLSPCIILNARCGDCTENCAFCAQSKSASAAINRFPLLSEDEMFKAAGEAASYGAAYFSIVTSGRSVKPGDELEKICRVVSRIADELPVKPCASLGILDKDSLEALKNAGLVRYHHNLEASRSYFPSICGTRTYEDQINTILFAKAAGLEVCSGGIFGMGESTEQRIELLETIRGLDVDSVPVNFLTPIPGTRLEKMNDLTPLDCLKIIAVARLMMPEKSIRICGGREHNLRDLHSWIFFAGADGVMLGNYLVTSGRSIEKDLRLFSDLKLTTFQ